MVEIKNWLLDYLMNNNCNTILNVERTVKILEYEEYHWGMLASVTDGDIIISAKFLKKDMNGFRQVDSQMEFHDIIVAITEYCYDIQYFKKELRPVLKVKKSHFVGFMKRMNFTNLRDWSLINEMKSLIIYGLLRMLEKNNIFLRKAEDTCSQNKIEEDIMLDPKSSKSNNVKNLIGNNEYLPLNSQKDDAILIVDITIDELNKSINNNYSLEIHNKQLANTELENINNSIQNMKFNNTNNDTELVLEGNLIENMDIFDFKLFRPIKTSTQINPLLKNDNYKDHLFEKNYIIVDGKIKHEVFKKDMYENVDLPKCSNIVVDNDKTNKSITLDSNSFLNFLISNIENKNKITEIIDKNDIINNNELNTLDMPNLDVLISCSKADKVDAEIDAERNTAFTTNKMNSSDFSGKNNYFENGSTNKQNYTKLKNQKSETCKKDEIFTDTKFDSFKSKINLCKNNFNKMDVINENILNKFDKLNEDIVRFGNIKSDLKEKSKVKENDLKFYKRKRRNSQCCSNCNNKICDESFNDRDISFKRYIIDLNEFKEKQISHEDIPNFEEAKKLTSLKTPINSLESYQPKDKNSDILNSSSKINISSKPESTNFNECYHLNSQNSYKNKLDIASNDSESSKEHTNLNILLKSEINNLNHNTTEKYRSSSYKFSSLTNSLNLTDFLFSAVEPNNLMKISEEFNDFLLLNGQQVEHKTNLTEKFSGIFHKNSVSLGLTTPKNSLPSYQNFYQPTEEDYCSLYKKLEILQKNFLLQNNRTYPPQDISETCKSIVFNYLKSK